MVEELDGPIEAMTIRAPRFKRMELLLRGTSPYMQARFSEKALGMMRSKMEAGSVAKKGTKREARDFAADFRGAMHLSEDGWPGIPAPAFRNACIDACRMAGYKMTHAKMSVFIVADGLDAIDGTPLVRLYGKPPEGSELPVRNATGVADIRVRPMWRQWSVVLQLRFDGDQFTEQDVANLVSRAGMQVGVGEGRPYSKASYGLGFGCWELAQEGGDARIDEGQR